MKYIYEYRNYLIFLAILYGGLILMSNLPRKYYKTDLEKLVSNWDTKQSYITKAVNMVKSKTYAGLTIRIRFDGNVITVDKRVKDSSGKLIEKRLSELFLEGKFGDIKKETGFSYAEMIALKSCMDKAEIKEINSAEPCVLNWSGSGFNGYGYFVFRKSLSDSLRKEFGKAPCRYYQMNDSVVIVAFGGPAWGSDPCLMRQIRVE